MIALFFITILQISFLTHVYFLISYISKKQDRYFKGFLTTALTNIFIGIFLAVLVLGTTAAVVVALFLVMWRERTSSRDPWVAIVSGCVLAAWAALTQ